MGTAQALDLSFTSLSELVDTINCGMMARDAELQLVFANATLARWLGYDRDELIGKRTEDLVPPELRERQKDEIELIKQGDLRARVTVLLRRDGTAFPALVIPALWVDDLGRAGAAVAIIVDLATVQTAKQAGYATSEEDVRGRLDRIAAELQSIGLSVAARGQVGVPLDHPALGALTPREKEVLALLVSGERVATISKQLFISAHTVRNHLKSAYRKLGVKDQTELIQHVRSLADRDGG